MPLILHDLEPLHWAVAGVGIAGVTLALFWIGWSMAGTCPGPILVNVGEGKICAVAALAGALVGAGLLGSLYPALQRPFAMPPLKVGAGEG